jgi:hypothetical protein
MRQASELLMLEELRAGGSRLELAFVYAIRYGGAGPLLAESNGEKFVAGLVAKWTVAYQLY